MVGNLTTDLDFYDAAAGTSLSVVTGGPAGLISVFAASVGLDPDTNQADEIALSVPPVVMGGVLTSPETATGTQVIKMIMDVLLFFEEGTGGFPRGLDVRLLIQRSLP
jgi:hypothetical protein